MPAGSGEGRLPGARGGVPLRAGVLLAASLTLSAPLPATARAQAPLIESGDFSLDVGGYVRTLTGIHDTGYDVPGGARRSGFHGVVGRVEWRALWGGSLALEVHDRIQARVSTAEGASGFGGSVAGFGVSADPGRAVDLESFWIEDDRLQLWHDVDRLAVTAYTPVADVTLGRQAITWGTSFLFPVADLWAQFSPYELDTERKPGVDALRILAYPASGLEVDAVVADRGATDAVSVGVRATWSLTSADVFGAAGRLWNEAMAMAGITWLFETTKLRAEAVVSRDVDRDRWLDPRGTVGVDRIGSRWTAAVEYHFNGLGAGGPEGYPARLASESFIRGESYYLGRNYLGATASWSADAQERIRLSGSVLANLGDPSGAFLPTLAWDPGDATSLSLGALLTVGDEPDLGGGASALGSEYGTYGDLGYARISIYY